MSSSSKYKHTAVPAALHHELSEYTALLRALRTNHIQDLSQHLLLGPSTPSASSPPLTASPGRPTSPERNEDNVDLQAKRQAELWTRWPHLADDAPVPEWGFDDEIKSIALRALRDMPLDNTGGTQPSSELVLEEDRLLSLDTTLEPMLPHLVQSAYTTLGNILDEIAFHRPKTVRSMVNRFRPVRWQNVVELARERGELSLEAIDGLEEQLGAIFRVEGGGESADEPKFVRGRRRERRCSSPSHGGTFVKRRDRTKAELYDPLCFMKLPTKPLLRQRRPVARSPSVVDTEQVPPDVEAADRSSQPEGEQSPTGRITRSQGKGRHKQRPEHQFIKTMPLTSTRRKR